MARSIEARLTRLEQTNPDTDQSEIARLEAEVHQAEAALKAAYSAEHGREWIDPNPMPTNLPPDQQIVWLEREVRQAEIALEQARAGPSNVSS